MVKLHLEDNDVRSEGTKHIAEMLRENNTLTQLVGNRCRSKFYSIETVIKPNLLIA